MIYLDAVYCNAEYAAWQKGQALLQEMLIILLPLLGQGIPDVAH